MALTLATIGTQVLPTKTTNTSIYKHFRTQNCKKLFQQMKQLVALKRYSRTSVRSQDFASTYPHIQRNWQNPVFIYICIWLYLAIWVHLPATNAFKLICQPVVLCRASSAIKLLLNIFWQFNCLAQKPNSQLAIHWPEVPSCRSIGFLLIHIIELCTFITYWLESLQQNKNAALFLSLNLCNSFCRQFIILRTLFIRIVFSSLRISFITLASY